MGALRSSAFALGLLMGWCSAAWAIDDQTVAKCVYNAAPPTMIDGKTGPVQCDVNGILKSTATLTSGGDASGANQALQITQETTAATGITTIAGSLGGCAGQTVANTSVTPINNSGSATSIKLVTKSSAKQVYICAIDIVAAGANNVALVEGTKTTTECDTATAGLAGGTTAATGWNLGANGGLAKGSGTGIVFRTATVTHDVCLFFSAANQVSGSITWAQF